MPLGTVSRLTPLSSSSNSNSSSNSSRRPNNNNNSRNSSHSSLTWLGATNLWIIEPTPHNHPRHRSHSIRTISSSMRNSTLNSSTTLPRQCSLTPSRPMFSRLRPRPHRPKNSNPRLPHPYSRDGGSVQRQALTRQPMLHSTRRNMLLSINLNMLPSTFPNMPLNMPPSWPPSMHRNILLSTLLSTPSTPPNTPPNI